MLQDLARRPVPGECIPLPSLAMLLWPCRCAASMDIYAVAGAAASMQDGKVGRSGLCSAARNVGSTMCVIGSSDQCGRFYADQC